MIWRAGDGWESAGRTVGKARESYFQYFPNPKEDSVHTQHKENYKDYHFIVVTHLITDLLDHWMEKMIQ